MFINDRGEFVGSVSGGCVETAVMEEARAVLAGGQAKLLEYGVTNDRAWEVGLACGGSVQVFLERLDGRVLLDEIAAALRERRTLVLRTELEDLETEAGAPSEAHNGSCSVTVTFGNSDSAGGEGLAEMDSAMPGQARSEIVTMEGREFFVDVIAPPPRVLIVGAVHIAQALVPMARAAGLEVIVVDPRTTFATADRFPDTPMVHAWPAAAFAELGLDAHTAVVALTHDPKLDDPALTAALEGDVFYVGALGSRRTHARRVERLSGNGVAATALERIHAPIGLDIGARTPGEIAASILAEVVRELRSGPTGP